MKNLMDEDKQIKKDRLIQLLKYCFNEINQYLNDDDVIEVMLNPDKKLWIDTLSKGRIFTGHKLEPSKAMSIINTVASHMKMSIDKKNPTLSAELPESGSRFEAVLTGINPVFTIRKKALLIFTLDDYVNNHNLTISQKNIIVEAIKDHQNILIVGGTSTGKTTFANACIDEMSKLNERIVILEDTEELQSTAEDSVQLKTTIYADLKRLLKSTMRLRPDRIIVGEIRDGVALDLLTAWNSGHSGGLTTIHSDSALGGLKQLEQYIQRISISKQEELIAKVINVIIVLERIGVQRKVTSITKVKKYRNGEYLLQKI
jgi:type IV secretion system protein VirB11